MADIDVDSDPRPLDAAARTQTFWLDAQHGAVADSLERRDIRSILLKGPAFDQLLYGSRRVRPYTDIDLLVNPARYVDAERELARLGFKRFEPEGFVRQTDPTVAATVGVMGASHATAWVRPTDLFAVDLHDTLPQAWALPAHTWSVLTEHLTTISVAGRPTQTLAPPAACVLIALHAAHHGPAGHNGPVRDLKRAIEVLPPEDWEAAARIAQRLGADEAFAVGLSVIPTGRDLAAALGISPPRTDRFELAWADTPWAASVVSALRAQPSLARRLSLLRAVALPSAQAMKRGSALARRGPLGLSAAYTLRLLRLVWLSVATATSRHSLQ